MRNYILVLIFICLNYQSQGSYIDYYRSLNQIDSLFFLANKKDMALKAYKKLCNEFDFIWVYDALKYCQMALVEKQEDLAVDFMNIAIENGYKVEYNQYMKLGCPCNIYKEYLVRNTMLDSFILKNKKEFLKKEQMEKSKYLTNLNIYLIKKVNYMHVEDEIFKVWNPFNANSSDKQIENWNAILKLNAIYLDSLFRNRILIGQRNLGLYDALAYRELGIENFSTDSLVIKIGKAYNVPDYSIVPIVNMDEYFSSTPLFITYHHSRSYIHNIQELSDKMIREGYIHPKEYVYIFVSDCEHKLYLGLAPTQNYPSKISNRHLVDSLRKNYNLPSIALDSARHSYQHEHNVKLFFGFFNGTG